MLPWLKPVAIHNIYLPKTGNGWQSDLNADFLYPPKRTRLIIRVSQDKIEKLKQVENLELTLTNSPSLIIEKFIKQRKLSDSSVLFAHSIVAPIEQSEDDFLQHCWQSLKQLNILPKKMLVGLRNTIEIKEKTLHTRSLMLADLSKQESVTLQEKGLGYYQHLGCGIFIPQKSINEVNAV
eukprot:GHVR01135858.1.p1 GENE.GHVR01135858.1~~GHVR01135858.1.p1  ORF type:complete len:209 (-),score=10.96 GHVR01135858.1:52-591(-)